MASYVIEGSHPIAGRVQIPGSKNAVTKVLMASLLSEEPSEIGNVPPIFELDLTLDLLASLGARIERNTHRVRIQRGPDFHSRISKEQASHNRMAVLAVAPLLHAFGSVTLPKNLGGDRIGPRPVNFHLDAYRQLGASVEETEENYLIRCEGLKGGEITLPYPSVSTTENVLLAASLAKGTTLIRGAAVEPEVLDLVLFLQKMGAIIEHNTDRTYVVEGRERLKGTRHFVLPDRITCASYAALAIATGGRIEAAGARQEHMLAFLNTLRRMNAPFEVGDGITFGNLDRPALKPVSLETNVHPGFMTDWQPPTVILMTQASGSSVLHETVYENRLEYTQTLARMGGQIQLDTRCLGGSPCRFHYKDHLHSCVVRGPTLLKGTDVEVPDLRAGFSYVIAALCARGRSRITHIERIERGYGELHTTLAALGARIERVED